MDFLAIFKKVNSFNESKKNNEKENLISYFGSGVEGADNSGETDVAMTGIMNIVSVLNGEKTVQEALVNTANAGGKGDLIECVGTNIATVFEHQFSTITSKFTQALTAKNIPGKIITAVVETGDTIKNWANGEITTQECIIQLGEKGVNMAAMYSITVGQAVIPIPVVGAAIGGLVGSMLTSSLYETYIKDLQVRQMEHEQRMRAIAEYEGIAEKYREYRAQLENYFESYLAEFRYCFDSALSDIQTAFLNDDADGIIAGANQITRKLGGTVQFETVSEFKTFLDSGEDFIL